MDAGGGRFAKTVVFPYEMSVTNAEDEMYHHLISQPPLICQMSTISQRKGDLHCSVT